MSQRNEDCHVHIRWMIRRDMEEVMSIESAVDYPWTEEEFTKCLRVRKRVGMVAEHSEAVVGFMIYELERNLLNILNFGVQVDHKKRSVGTQMVNKLKSKLSRQRRSRITLDIR